MAVVDFRDADVIARDPANQDIVKRVSHKTLQFGMFTTTANAWWAADRVLAREAYTPGVVSLPANRYAFRLQVGDPFLLTYAPYSISEKVYRVVRIEEEDLSTEDIKVYAVEDISYIYSKCEETPIGGTGGAQDILIETLDNTVVYEAPYALSADNIEIITLAGRENGTELGYLVLLSLDGTSYTQINACTSFAIHGTLVADYSSDTYRIDDSIGFQIDFDNDDVDKIETISRIDLWGSKNLALLGTEIITFQTITPVSGDRYTIDNIYRGRFDTDLVDHLAGEDFYYLGYSKYGRFQNENFVPSSTRYFKFNPYNSQYSGDASEAAENSIAIVGRARKPYKPLNLQANENGINAKYADDVILTWRARVRGAGAGVTINWLNYEAESWEGYFEIEVYVNDILMRTTTEIDALTWTYTEAMNIDDNGSLADTIVFKILNYRLSGGVTYSSDQIELTVEKE